MKKHFLRRFVRSFTCFVLVVALFPVISPVQAAGTPGIGQPGSASSNAYLELGMDPPFASPGSLVTLHITYHNIGEVYAYIAVSPPDLVAFDPPLASPCKYYEHPDGCQSITLRALADGVVEFSVSATGEVWDADCHCWYMGGAYSVAPARLVIADQVWSMFLPAIRN